MQRREKRRQRFRAPLLLLCCAAICQAMPLAQQSCVSKTVLLQSGGPQMPLLAFGTGTSWFRRDDRGNDDLLRTSVLQALQGGVRHLDCAGAMSVPAYASKET
eukprot:scaffold7347_cov223-Pinguiococcus_pyrenoidosus.AAC.2